jgi:hypothetical protein
LLNISRSVRRVTVRFRHGDDWQQSARRCNSSG